MSHKFTKPLGCFTVHYGPQGPILPPHTSSPAPRYVHDRPQPVADVDLGTRWLNTSHEIVRHYLCSWFTLDILSILVSVFDIIPVVVMSVASSSASATGEHEGGENLSALQSLTPLRLLRALRLLRLLRLSKMARILTRSRPRPQTALFWCQRSLS